MSDTITKAVEAAARKRHPNFDKLPPEIQAIHLKNMRADAAAFLDAVKDAPTEEMDLAGRSVAFTDLEWRCPAGCEPNDPECSHALHAYHNHDGAERIWRAMRLALRRGVEGGGK